MDDMKLTDTLTKGTFNVQTALALARVSDLAYYKRGERDKQGIPCDKEAKEDGIYYEDDVKKWANINGINVQLFHTKNRDLQGFFCSWEDGVLERGKKRKRNNCGILVFRGSEITNWVFRNVRTKLMPHPCKWGVKSIMGEVHTGFCKGILSMEICLEPFDDTIEGLDHLWICGHSLGGALGVLAATRYRCMHIKDIQSMEIYTFGQPMVGCPNFARQFNKRLPGQLYRVTNRSDGVPGCPLEWMRHPGDEYFHPGSHWHINNENEFDAARMAKSSNLGAEEAEEIDKEDWDVLRANRHRLHLAGGNITIQTLNPNIEAGAFGGVPSLPVDFKLLTDHSIKKYINNLKTMLK